MKRRKTPSQEINFFSRSSVRVAVGVLVAALSFLGLIWFISFQFQQSMIEIRKQELKRLVTLGLNAIGPILREYENGKIEKTQALHLVRSTIRRLVYDDHTTPNYLFMSSYDGIMLVQPFEPAKEGSSQWDLRDSHGTYIIRELIRAARRGSGFVEYYYPPPGGTEPQKKISYVVGIDSLSCYLGTGLYLGDIVAVMSRYIRSGTLALLSCFFLFGVITTLLFRPYYIAYHVLLDKFYRIARRPEDIDSRFPFRFPKNSEVWYFMKSFREMLARLEENQKSLKEVQEHTAVSLREKEVLLKEVHHRVKNNLQIVSSLLSLQTHSIEDDKVKSALTESGIRIRSMALIHEMLYSTGIFHDVDMAQYLKSIVSGLIQSYGASLGAVDFRYAVEPVRLGLDEAILCGIIVTELVTNTLKYAFPGGRPGRLTVSLRSEGEEILLGVEDDGVGFAEDLLAREGKSLGIVLVKALTRQLEGSITASGNGGANFLIRFPKK